MDVNEKVDNFRNNIIKRELKKKYQDYEASTQSIKNNISNYIRLCLDDALNEIETIKTKCFQESNTKYTQILFDERKYLFNMREAISKNFFDTLKKELIDFTKTERYRDLILQELEAISNKYNDYLVELSCDDDTIKFVSDKKVIRSNKNFIGGYIIILNPTNRLKKIIDRSFACKLEKCKKNIKLF